MPVGVGFEVALPTEIVYTKYQRRKDEKKDIPLASNAIFKETTKVTEESQVTIVPDINALDLNEKKEVQTTIVPLDRLNSTNSDKISEASSSRSGSTSDASTASSMSDVSDLSKGSKSSSKASISSAELDLALTATLANPIAILPQYVAETARTITISEASFPHLSSNFTVTSVPYSPPSASASTDSIESTQSGTTSDKDSAKVKVKANSPDTTADGESIFAIHRERPSLTHRQVITTPDDTDFKSPLVTIRRRHGHLPLTHSLTDPSGARIGEIQGNFSAPFSGAKATMVFTNAYTNQKTKLALQGSWHNRRAVIREEVTGEMVATMSSDYFTWKNALGGRRNYEVFVRAGVDVLMVVSMIVALDERAE